MKNSIMWLGSPEERILSIRKFRKYISTLPLEEAINETMKQWENSPTIKKDKFDILEIESWPTPWELFSENTFCKNAQCLGSIYTLTMSEHGKNTKFSLGVINDVIEGISPAILIGDNYLSEMTNCGKFEVITSEQIKSKIKE